MTQVNPIPFPEIQTTRLRLRKLTPRDWEAVSFLRTDPEVNRFVKRPVAGNRKQALAFISKITTAVDSGVSCYWAISLLGDHRMIGSICLWNFSKDRRGAEVGYDLSPKFQGKGLMDESLKAILHFGFTNLSLHSIEAFTHKDNAASLRLLIRNGFAPVPGKIDEDNQDNLILEIKSPAGNIL